MLQKLKIGWGVYFPFQHITKIKGWVRGPGSDTSNQLELFTLRLKRRPFFNVRSSRVCHKNAIHLDIISFLRRFAFISYIFFLISCLLRSGCGTRREKNLSPIAPPRPTRNGHVFIWQQLTPSQYIFPGVDPSLKTA